MVEKAGESSDVLEAHLETLPRACAPRGLSRGGWGRGGFATGPLWGGVEISVLQPLRGSRRRFCVGTLINRAAQTRGPKLTTPFGEATLVLWGPLTAPVMC